MRKIVYFFIFLFAVLSIQGCSDEALSSLMDATTIDQITIDHPTTTDQDTEETTLPPFILTIHFETNGGSEIETVVINDINYQGGFVTPEKEGYAFLGWYIDLNGAPFDYNFSAINEVTLTLHAKWEKQAFQLTFNDHDGHLLHQETVLYDEFLEDSYLESPTRVGYTFNGWDIDLPNKMPAHDVIATATYLVNRYRISFETYEGSAIDTIEQDFNTPIEVNDPTYTGHQFLGWYLDETFEIEFTDNVVPAEDITLYAKWEKQAFQLTFNDHDGHLLHQETVLYDEFLEDSYLESPTRVGYTFNGWDIDLPNKMPAHDVIATATYLINRYRISFETYEGSAIDTIEQDFNTPIEVNDPTYMGHQFLGWYLDETFEIEFTDNVVPAEDITLYAKWEKQTYTITFDSSGGDFFDAITASYMDPIELPIPEILGYQFEGWYVDYDYSEVFDSEVMGSQDIHLVAKWKVAEYQVNYYLLGGTNHENNPLTVDGSKEIPLYDPSMDGFTFLGWYLNHHFMGEPVTSIEKGVRTDIELHAKWQLNQHQINYVMVENSMYGNVGILNSGESIIDIVDGYEHTILLTSEHRVFVYGDRNLHQFGTGDYTDYNYPFDITDNFNLDNDEYIINIYAGEYHSAALTSNNRLFMWGSNGYGQSAVSVFDTTSISLPRDVTAQFNLYPTEEFMEVALGDRHSIVTTNHGRIFTFGYNKYGELGLGQEQDKVYSTPVEITLSFNLDPLKFEYVKHINAHGNSSIAVTSENRVFVWGLNSWGTLGTGEGVSFYPGLHEITSLFDFNEGEEVITAKIERYGVGVLITTFNRVFVWGKNSSGQLGIGIAYDREIYPVSEVNTGIVFDEDETLIDATPGDVTILLTSKGRFFITGYRDLLVNTVVDRPERDRTVFAERSSFFNLEEGEMITKINYATSQKRSVLTSNGNILSWGQLHLLGMGDDPKWRTNLPSPINLVEGIHQVDYYYTEVIAGFEHQIEGYQFLGWFSDSSLETPFDLTNMPDSDIVVYGYYQKNQLIPE